LIYWYRVFIFFQVESKRIRTIILYQIVAAKLIIRLTLFIVYFYSLTIPLLA
jgi:hypothetical protein